MVCNYGGMFLPEDYVEKHLYPDKELCNYLVELRVKNMNSLVTVYLNHDDSTHSFGKYINHSKIHPNLGYKIYATSDAKVDIIFFAKKPIYKGNEILYNYGDNFSGVKDCVQSCYQCKNVKRDPK